MRIEEYNFFVADLEAANNGDMVGEWLSVEDIALSGVQTLAEELGYSEFSIQASETPFFIAELFTKDVDEFSSKLVQISEKGIAGVADEDIDAFLIDFFIDRVVGTVREINDELDLLLSNHYTINNLGKCITNPEVEIAQNYVNNLEMEDEFNLLIYIDYKKLGCDLAQEGFLIKDGNFNSYFITE